MDWITRLDYWIVDWTGLTSELVVCVPHDLHPIRCTELGHMLAYIQERMWHAYNCGSFAPKRPWKAGLYILQQMELLGRPVGTLVYSKASRMATFNKTMGNSLVTTNQFGILHQRSLWLSKFCSEEAFISALDALCIATCYSHRVLWAHCVYTMNSWVHIRPCSLCIVHSCTFTSIQWED